MFKAINETITNWRNATLIVPCVSVGNVGQLSVDMIISSLNLDKVGFIYHSAILPVVGNDPYKKTKNSQCKLTTGCEVYCNETCDLVVIQQRSPLVKGKKEEYSTWLSDWIKCNNFMQVVVLTSSFSHERIDQQIPGSQLRILMSSTMEERNSKMFLEKLNWKPLEKRSCVSSYEMGDSELSKDLVYLPGSGIAKQLFNKCSELPVLIMSVFCAEGDNIQDAICLSNYLNSWLQLIDKENKSKPSAWNMPISWKLIYGNAFDQTLFH